MNVPLLRDRYELGPVLGSGRGSTTQLATVVGSGERCVVKSLSVGEVVRSAGGGHSFDPDDFTKLVELFEREARVLSQLDHPGIPRFIDHFTEEVGGDTRLYTVQEFVEGKTLEAHVEQGRHFTEDEAREVCRQIAEILVYLHDRSPPLIHRDIKPTNVILDGDGTVHLVDFGSVRNAIGGDDLDGKTIVGTYGYMPVEQYEARAVPQSDLYALGMTLVYMLSHREPTEIPRTGMVLDFRQHVNVSADFASILERMIRPAPEDRYSSARKLLDRLSGPSPQAVFESVAVAPSDRSVARKRAIAVAGVSLVLLLGVLLSVLPNLVARMSPASDGAPEPLTMPAGPPVTSASSEPTPPVSPVDGVLTIDMDRDFRYMPEGFPMGRAAGQTELPPLTSSPGEQLTVPDAWREPNAEVHYGYLPLGNALDPHTAFALGRRAGVWQLLIDQDNDEDLTDNGSPRENEGSGPIFAAELYVEVEVIADSPPTLLQRPYHLWIWFDETGGVIRGRFYARHHYAGTIAVEAGAFDVTIFEDTRHDAFYRESGACIDLSRDGECQEDTELFHDGDVVPFPDEPVRLLLDYP